MKQKSVNVIGAGLAGCEAAWTLAQKGIKVNLYEMKPKKKSPAHHSDMLCELVCSNSLKAARIESAAGLLKEEMRRLGSVTMMAAAETSVSAGGALAVDRELFSSYVTEKITNHPNINLISDEVKEINFTDEIVIIATGPLTSDALAEKIKELCGDALSFYDAAAPIVSRESLNMSKIFAASRYGRGEDDYLNCPFNKEEYTDFYNALISAESVELKEFEKSALTVYEGCMPIEIMAKRGEDTIRFGPLKPVGLRDPKTDKRPWAVVQLRKENAEGTLLNIVGFQTNLKFPEQKRVFSMIPGMENAEFIRYGVMHRNTFINSPKVLTPQLNLKNNKNIFFAGQITGVEGYIESAASGIFAALNAANLFLKGRVLSSLPEDTMLGALIGYITNENVVDFQPMGSNMGILPSLDVHIKSKQERYSALSARALNSLDCYIKSNL
ncbi:MAG: FADH(2)-oxidizing methylenetetrahydrofolate--tRNA-(uracil(54)-C(5))-methyltransferase TrmFO [Ruminococcaceae bacterium]|nr:FADH(2)-oxidizing methylenetetrahydrofolate--tRNA-(uracil(54)-C(5))-methyltransferase TrmFO [Oscillospiraceae bacterium]